jgi:hypothetical protein
MSGPVTRAAIAETYALAKQPTRFAHKALPRVSPSDTGVGYASFTSRKNTGAKPPPGVLKLVVCP